MWIFQNSSLIKYPLGFFLLEPNKILLPEKYWSALVVISTALIGFSLTAYNIYRTRAERTAADSICRKYSFIEDSFHCSWRLMIIAVIMFLITFSLSLFHIILSNLADMPNPADGPKLGLGEWFDYIKYGIEILVIWVFTFCIHLWIYIYRFWKCGIYTIQDTNKIKYYIDWAKYSFIAILYILLILCAFLFLSRSAYFLVLLLGQDNFSDILKNEILEKEFQFTVIFSLVIGIFIMYSEYYLFQPKNILFNVEQSTRQNLKNVINDINDKCEGFKHISAWLKLIVAEARNKVSNSNEESPLLKKTITLLSRANTGVNGYHIDPFTDEKHKLIKIKDKHITLLEQFIKRGYATYDEIVSEMNGIELYLESLNKFEVRLKELPPQIDLLVNKLATSNNGVKSNLFSQENSETDPK